MRPYLLLAILVFTFNAFGQVAPGTTPGKRPVQVTASSKITVSYGKANDTNNIHNQPKYYINNTFYGDQGAIFNPDEIKSINIEKDTIYITLKNDHQPSFMTVEQLKKKYVHSKNLTAIYILDGNLIKNNLQMIDENYVLGIKVYDGVDLPYLKGQVTGIDIIQISLKSKANLEKANTIYIRGSNDIGK